MPNDIPDQSDQQPPGYPMPKASRRRLSDETTRTGYVALVRSDVTRDLLGDHNAFTLLTHIAMHARFHNKGTDGLKVGQAFVGRYTTGEKLNLSEGEVRSALKRLTKAGLIHREPTNLGTVVTLLDSSVFDIGYYAEDQPTTIGLPTNCHRTATNREGKIKNREKESLPSISLSEDDWIARLQQQNPAIDIADEIRKAMTGLKFSSHPEC